MLEPSLQEKKLEGKKLKNKVLQAEGTASNKALRQENWSWFPWEQKSFGMAKGTLGSGARAKMAWCTGEGQRELSSLVQARVRVSAAKSTEEEIRAIAGPGETPNFGDVRTS